LWLGTVAEAILRSGKFICRWSCFADRFIASLLGRGLQQSFSASGRRLPSCEKMANLTQRVHGNKRRAERTLRTLRPEHPARDRAERAVRKLARNPLAITALLSLVNRQ
jgi:hypothetical protein